jgi:hypothetical protein
MQMEFELRVMPAPAIFACLGGVVELREVPYGMARQALNAGGKRGYSAEGLLAVSLHVDGAPIGLDALLALPGRFTGHISKAMQAAVDLHGLEVDAEPAPAAPADPAPGGEEKNA